MADIRKLLGSGSTPGIRRCLSLIALALGIPSLTGCPLSDDYYVEHSSDGGGQPATGENGGGTNASSVTTQGAGGSAGADTDTTTSTGGGSNQAGGSSALDGDTASTGGREGTAATGSSGGETCAPACNSGRSCSDGRCEGGWLAMAEPPAGFVARQRAAVTAFQGKVFVFGGVDRSGEHLNTGAIYDPRTDAWSVIAVDDRTPSPRELASAVWTGSHVLVVGGSTGFAGEYLNDAALYDPDADRWTTIESALTPRARGIAGLVDGAVVLLQGLTTNGDTEIDAERYDLDSETWSLAGDPGDLSGLWSSAIAFGEHDVFIYGGNSNAGRTDAAYRYDVTQDIWVALPTALSVRSGCFAVHDGESFWVFGGHDVVAYDDGAVLASSEWKALPTGGAPSPRRAPPAWSGWAFALGHDDIAVMGGVDGADNVLVDGGRYSDTTGWKSIEAWPSQEAHAEGAGVWTGEEFVVWSGTPDDTLDPTLTGERWAP